MNVTELSQHITHQDIAPLYLVVGEEEYLQQAAREQFLKILPTDERDLNLGQYDLNETSLATALADAMSMPFLGERRVVFLNSPVFLTSEKSKIEQPVNELIDYLQAPTPTTALVIFAPYAKLDERKKVVKLLRQRAVIIDTAKLSEQAAREAFQYELKKQHLKITSQALQLLIQRTDADFSLMMAQLTKLALYAQSSHEIDQVAVTRLVTAKLEDNVFDLVDAVLNRKVKLALEQYQMLILQQEDPIKLNAVLLNQFRLLLQVKILQAKGYTQGTLATKLKVHPYRIKLALRQVKKFSKDDLIHAYLGLEKLEVGMKSSQMDRRMLFELFVLHFAKYKH